MKQASSCRSLRELSSRLRQLHDEKRTGWAMVLSAGGGSAQVHLVKGKIVSIAFRGKKGISSLHELGRVGISEFAFADGPPAPDDTSLPATDVILAEIDSFVTTVSSPATQVTQSSRAILEEALSDYIGAMATVVCQSHITDGQDLESAIRVLTGKIVHTGQAGEFAEKVRKKLKMKN